MPKVDIKPNAVKKITLYNMADPAGSLVFEAEDRESADDMRIVAQVGKQDSSTWAVFDGHGNTLHSVVVPPAVPLIVTYKNG